VVLLVADLPYILLRVFAAAVRAAAARLAARARELAVDPGVLDVGVGLEDAVDVRGGVGRELWDCVLVLTGAVAGRPIPLATEPVRLKAIRFSAALVVLGTVFGGRPLLCRAAVAAAGAAGAVAEAGEGAGAATAGADTAGACDGAADTSTATCEDGGAETFDELAAELATDDVIGVAAESVLFAEAWFGALSVWLLLGGTTGSVDADNAGAAESPPPPLGGAVAAAAGVTGTALAGFAARVASWLPGVLGVALASPIEVSTDAMGVSELGPKNTAGDPVLENDLLVGVVGVVTRGVLGDFGGLENAYVLPPAFTTSTRLPATIACSQISSSHIVPFPFARWA
jgi:hypothetical protein